MSTGGQPAEETVVSLWRLAGVRRLMLVTVLGFSSFCLTLASLPLWSVQGGAPSSAAGLVTTGMLASTVATQAAVPWLLSRFGTGRVLVTGLLALGAPAPFLVWSTQMGPLLLVAVVRGAGFALLTVVGATLTVAVAPTGRHGESVGLYGLAVALPNLVGVPAGVALTQHDRFGWVAVLAAAPIVAVPFALSLSRGLDPHRPRNEPRTPHRSTVRRVLAPSLVLLAVTLAGGGLLTFLPIARPADNLAAEALLLFGLTSAVFRWRVGVLADRIGTRWLLPGSLVVSVVGMVLVAAGLDLRRDAILLLGAAVFGASYGAVQNVSLVAAFERAGPEGTTTASSVWNAAFDAGTGIGAGVTGAIGRLVGLPGTYFLSAILMVAVLPAAGVRARRRDAADASTNTYS